MGADLATMFASINWASTVASALIGAIVGFTSAKLQDRQRRATRLRALGGALQADAKRIREELGDPADTYVELMPYGSVRAAPTIHKWTERLVTEAAEIDPQIVAEYLVLERLLHNFGHYLERLREASGTVARLQSELQEAESEGASRVGDIVMLRRQIERTQPIATHAHHMVVRARKESVARLLEIERLLEPYSTPLLKRLRSRVLALTRRTPPVVRSGEA